LFHSPFFKIDLRKIIFFFNIIDIFITSLFS